ncbi:sigma-70 family RNA polymerase sigma factor [Fulvivirgaceae bacterium BMA12]|uniref:Sigma-70 family RNA polymerase sigma factor n=1 Tax=Agaribacillus aureus TaxID=3051825 RepID=A0ABT8L5S5_9BACT|nr:sigma-70 family RNA polymerase sigma factor [Fulvivirgaceae bacterium BMA12]
MSYSLNTLAESLRYDREATFEKLYEQSFPTVANLVFSLGGSRADAQDMFQDALIIFYEKVMEKPDLITSSVHSYVLGIVKHLWIRKYHNDRKFISMSAWESEITIPADFYEPKESVFHLADYLAMAGKKCMALLEAFYYKKKSLKEIAASFGFSGIRSATSQKFKCLEKVRKQVKEKNLTYEQLHV